jgi:hypothetical protein
VVKPAGDAGLKTAFRDEAADLFFGGLKAFKLCGSKCSAAPKAGQKEDKCVIIR